MIIIGGWFWLIAAAGVGCGSLGFGSGVKFLIMGRIRYFHNHEIPNKITNRPVIIAAFETAFHKSLIPVFLPTQTVN
jgi:hypothetical protein